MKLSIITPTKDSSQFIYDNLYSVFHQPITPHEVEQIIIDGGSEDNTLSIIDNFKSECGADIKILESKDDEGMYHAINKGMRLITGDVWSELNSDDVYLPCFHDIFDIFTKQPAFDAVYGNVDMISETGKFIHTLYLPKFDLEYLILKGYCLTILQPALFLRTSTIDKIGYFNLNYKYASDYDFCIRLGTHCKLKKLPYSFTQYRIHPKSITWGNSSRRQIQSAETKQISEYYIQNMPVIRKNILLKDINMYANQIHFNNLKYISSRLKQIFIS